MRDRAIRCLFSCSVTESRKRRAESGRTSWRARKKAGETLSLALVGHQVKNSQVSLPPRGSAKADVVSTVRRYRNRQSSDFQTINAELPFQCPLVSASPPLLHKINRPRSPSCHGHPQPVSRNPPITAPHDADRPHRHSRPRSLGSAAPRSSRHLLHLAPEGERLSGPEARRRRCCPAERTEADEGFHRHHRGGPASLPARRAVPLLQRRQGLSRPPRPHPGLSTCSARPLLQLNPRRRRSRAHARVQEPAPDHPSRLHRAARPLPRGGRLRVQHNEAIPSRPDPLCAAHAPRPRGLPGRQTRRQGHLHGHPTNRPVLRVPHRLQPHGQGLAAVHESEPRPRLALRRHMDLHPPSRNPLLPALPAGLLVPRRRQQHPS